ncbi:MAG: ParA family protein [bacterium]
MTINEKSRTIAVVNQKGGVGKTTTSVNLAAALAQSGASVLLVDIDPQGNATSGLGIEKNKVTPTVYEAIIGNVGIHEAVHSTPEIPNLSVAPANSRLIGAEIELTSMLSRESKLKTALESLKQQYEYIIIDCPPSLGLLTVNALTAASTLLIPIQCEYYAMEGMAQLMTTVKMIKRSLNPTLKIEGVLLTMYDLRTNLSKEVAREIRKHFERRVFKIIIPRSVRLSEAPSYGKSIFNYDGRSKGAYAYNQLAQEVINNGQECIRQRA